MFNIKCNYETIINKKNEFIARIKEGEKICIETINAYGDRFKDLNELLTLINNKNEGKHHHPLTGPIYIENAKAGDIIKIHIYKIDTEEMAQSMSKTAGINPIISHEIADRIPVIAEKYSENEIYYCNEIKLNYRPMIGIIATTPNEGMIKTGHACARNGGNLDIPFVTENTDLYLPVDIDGAGLYLGDVHALQGYGELSGIAMEASSKIVFDVEILKARKSIDNILIIGKEPFSKRECIGVVGIGDKMKIENSVYDAFEGTHKIVKKLVPTMSENMIKSLITLIGNSFNGQAFSKTSESTSMVVISKEDISRITKNSYNNFAQEIKEIIFEREVI